MARTRRSRQAADAPAASVPAQGDTEQQAAPSRGRTRTSRAAPSKRQESVDNASSAAGPSRALPASYIRNTSVDSVEIGRRALETPSLRRDTTGLDLADDSVFGDLGDSFADVSDVDDRAAPRSASTTRSWSTFKPRSRASSFVGRNDPPIRPSSRGGAVNNSALTTSFSIGAFRRRAREPSILGTTRKGPRSETSSRGGGDGAQSDLESEGEELLPDAESTPLHTGRRRTRASLVSNAPVAATAAVQRRAVSANVSAGPATRKRKSEAAAAEERAAKTTRTEETDSDSEISDLDSPQMPPSTPVRQRAMTPVNLDEINAPPASSGSEDEGDVWPDIHALAKRRRRPSFTTPLRAAAGEDDEILSDISSPPSLTHSPNHESRAVPRGRAPLRAPQPKPLMTADLANLLPKRKYKKTRRAGANSDEEEEEEDVEEEDEEEEVPVTRTRGGRISRPPSRAASASGQKQQGGTPARRTRSASKHKTYGRRSSDKENNSDDEEVEDDSQFQPLADDTFEDTTAAAAPDFQSIDELKRATKKFSEVDKWQLEYEELSEGDSPTGAR
ncbi:hypothetical protein LEL_08246 [Akanthomyces lecanii RCEF 1005]|uniref:Uncharacterized protein n=1 Tax=Akanthomyces lecanii RCEF 1005 TaxID=1081108 RepID=A0A168F4S6_CORDF|nr:hypothetical protein LEL_08246 [Akanthomyces lecanii RCEF 1005]